MKKYICELVGTCMLTLIACGVAVITNGSIIATSLAFGLVIVAMAYSIGNVSGCHVNPAISLGMLISKRMKGKEFAGYVIAQFIGAIIGSILLGVLVNNFDTLGANTYGASGQLATNVVIALTVEAVLTFIFVLTVLGVTSKKENGHATGIVIGLTLTLVHLFGISFTGTSVNPARSLAPAIFQGGEAFGQVWVFIVAPLVGAAIAALFYRFVLEEKK